MINKMIQGVPIPMNLKVAEIWAEPYTQPRVAMNWLLIDDYAEAMKAGATFPPVTVFYDGAAYHLADGFHRLQATKRLGHETIAATVRFGSQREAVLYSVGANATHGLQRTVADKKRAVETLLADPEWREWSSREIARRCQVSCDFVEKVKTAYLSSSTDKSSISILRKASRNGKIYTINTTNIGQKLSPQVRQIARNSSLRENQLELLKLEKIAPDQQEAVAQKLEKGAAQTVREARQLVEREARRQALKLVAAPLVAETFSGEIGEDDEDGSYSTLYQVENKDNIAHFRANSVDLILTDPPYNISGKGGLTRVGPDNIEANFDGVEAEEAATEEEEGEGWDHYPSEVFSGLLQGWVKEWARVVRPGGAVIAFTDRVLISDLWRMLKQAGLKPKSIITWVKTNPPPTGLIRRNLISATEFMIWAVKPGETYTFNEVAGWNRSNVITTTVISQSEKVDHPTQKPLSVLMPLIELTSQPGQLILDPFAGSGSTGLAALKLGRRVHLVERNPQYVVLAQMRLKEFWDGRKPPQA